MLFSLFDLLLDEVATMKTKGRRMGCEASREVVSDITTTESKKTT
jgi:hypothetical protein